MMKSIARNSSRIQRAIVHKAHWRAFSNSLPLATAPTAPTNTSSDNNSEAANLVSSNERVNPLRLNHSFEPIPYTSELEISPLNVEVGGLGHKKVTVVGCGQVGMAIAYSVLNQQTAGTIALVDMNREKLEGEAKDLEQGSAFHQQVRILASDEYVSSSFFFS